MNVAVSMRITNEVNYHEIRDSISHDLVNNLVNQNLVPIPIPNSDLDPAKYFKKIPIDGLILSGGDDLIFEENLSQEKKNKYKRDKVELNLLNFALSKKIPIIGICRGMQLINIHFGGKLTLLSKKSHINTNHQVTTVVKTNIFPEKKFIVNSFHKNIIKKEEMSSEFFEILYSEDDSVESFVHKKLPIIGVMFHPERKFKQDRIHNFFTNLFYKNVFNFLLERKWIP